jgi:hypothetical protein
MEYYFGMKHLRAFLLAAGIVIFALPASLFAHEVYVLSRDSVREAMSVQSPNPFQAYVGNEYQFYFWGIVSAIVFSTVVAASLFRVLERSVDPFLFVLKKYALPVARVTVGLCFVAFAYSGNIYGSELFLSEAFGTLAPALQLLIMILGLCAIFGFATRLAGLGMLFLYFLSLGEIGSYVLTYTDFLGVALLLIILGGGMFSLDEFFSLRTPRALSFTKHLTRLAFPILRICFGWGVLYASVYAKFIHSELALHVVREYDLTRFFPFDPLFVVLGAFIIEAIAGLMLIFGVAIRWTLLFLAFWLTLSLLYFQELIWPHGILFGLATALFLHGYDHFSLEGYVLKKGKREPVF